MSAQKPLELILARNLLSSISTPALLLGEQGSLLFYNEAAGAMLGRSFEEQGTMTSASAALPATITTSPPARSRSSAPHPAHPPASRPHSGADVLRPRLPDALAFGHRVGAQRLLLFHHDPLHTDDFLDNVCGEIASRWQRLGGRPGQVELAAERRETVIADVAAPSPQAS
jgi:hypothetical protein